MMDGLLYFVLVDKEESAFPVTLDQILHQGVGLDTWNWGVFITFLITLFSVFLAIGSLIVALWSYKYTKLTKESIEREAEKDRIDKECQYLLLRDIIRHLYRNKVCTLAMLMKFRKNPSQYPSEEHFLKLQLLPKDLYLEQFYKDPSKFDLLHELELKFRNYNKEIEVAMKHISDPNLDEATKIRDFGTLCFKPDYLSLEVLKVVNRIWTSQGVFGKQTEEEWDLLSEKEQNERELSTKNAENFKHLIHKEQKKNRSKNSKLDSWGEADSSLLDEDMATDKFYTPLFAKDEGYKKRLWEDVCIECGRNSKEKEKIHMIERRSRNEQCVR